MKYVWVPGTFQELSKCYLLLSFPKRGPLITLKSWRRTCPCSCPDLSALNFRRVKMDSWVVRVWSTALSRPYSLSHLPKILCLNIATNRTLTSSPGLPCHFWMTHGFQTHRSYLSPPGDQQKAPLPSACLAFQTYKDTIVFPSWLSLCSWTVTWFKVPWTRNCAC